MQRVESHRQRLEQATRQILPGRSVTMTDAVVALLEDALARAERHAEGPPAPEPDELNGRR